jgi:hypothetical protein
MSLLTASERQVLREAVSEATRAALPPNARPGHPSRFGHLRSAAADTGREVWFPDLGWYETLPPSKPAILAALNG